MVDKPTEALKPCPFCGGEARVITCEKKGHMFFGTSTVDHKEGPNCAYAGWRRNYRSEEAAIKTWNTRHTPEPTEAETEEAMLDELRKRGTNDR